ncbi:hypothetical protein N7532_001280 [Penicillium argentinense]|uniref:RecF/RecN/SMC N-terminal domain-containing protein n=1 Tax=Penicillium argentinense TaxID=1131581 RepID=A0A9W9KLK7_9EURO|nr:uncharacterized protein N7532_001280 [Penicillium argentinense]KAJ5110745.1 hypothetical protein N7532_001280 [Penicillium argentinense]
MPSLKRDQPSSDAEDSSEEGSQNVASSPLPSRKRTRTSASLSSNDSSASNSERDPTLDDEVLEDEDELELRQTQIIQEKYAHLLDESNVPAEHGILERVDCYNFMCHDHFSVELGPLINFIIGKNGSGKSAILTAITLCLGGKASATNRGQSLKNFIKEGRDQATIIVRIKNQGDGAYMSDDYGKSIIVERIFSKSGSSGFKIKSENGRIISTKKAELDAICDYFSLQIDNPMNVLSQDMARQFLSTSSAAEKYKFFVKGVQLEQLDQDYRLIEEYVDQMEEKLRNKSEDIGTLENRRNVAKRKLEMSDKHNLLRERRKNIRQQLAWAQVEDQEKIRDSLANDFTRADEGIARSEAELVQFDSALQAADVELETATEHAWRAASALENGQNDRKEIEEEIQDSMNHRFHTQAEQRTIREKLKAAEGRIQEMQSKIADENRRLAEISDGSFARKQQESEEAASSASAAREKWQQHATREALLRESIGEAKEKERSAVDARDTKKADFEEARTYLQNQIRESGSSRYNFPATLPALLKAIEQEASSFTSRPIGPMGYHVTLLQPKWASIVENSIGGTLAGFIVAHKRDSDKLAAIMRRVNCNCHIFISSGGDIDTSSNEPNEKYDTVLRILRIDNPKVRRQLIINHSVEQMLLIENVEEASRELYDGRRPKNVRRCFCIDATDRRRGIHLSYNAMGDPNQAPVPMYNNLPRMKSDVASQVSAQREVVDDLERQLNGLESELQSARSYREATEQALIQHRRESGNLKIDWQKLEDRAEEIRTELEKENAADGILDGLRSNLQEAEKDKEIYDASYQESVRAMDEQVQTLKEKRRRKSAKDRELDELLAKTRVADGEKSRVEGERREILNAKNSAFAQIAKDKERRDKLQDKLNEATRRVLEYTEKAAAIFPRVPIDEGETANSLDQKFAKLTQDLNRFSQRLGASRDEIAAEAGRAEAAYQGALTHVKELATLTHNFKDTLNSRKKRWEIFRSHISSRAKAQFTYLLSERSFRGRLLTNHSEKLLDLQVEPDITKDDSTGRNTKTLSGGEKSFSQVCLLLALWEAMGSPIRCLDEFDVYMDHINRKMAIDMLMIAARRSIGRQFILITPGSKTDITIAPDVRVKELAEPERGQTTLRFSR